MTHSDRNSLRYPRDEYVWHREQARGDGVLSTAVGWAYHLPLLLVTLLWWFVTRVIAVPYAVLKWLAGWVRRR